MAEEYLDPLGSAFFKSIRRDFAAIETLRTIQAVRRWITAILGKEITDLGEQLQNGVILCRILEKIDPQNYGVDIYMKGLYHMRPKTNDQILNNLYLFLETLRQMGVKETFTENNLLNNKTFSHIHPDIANCIYALAKKVNERGFLPKIDEAQAKGSISYMPTDNKEVEPLDTLLQGNSPTAATASPSKGENEKLEKNRIEKEEIAKRGHLENEKKLEN